MAIRYYTNGMFVEHNEKTYLVHSSGYSSRTAKMSYIPDVLNLYNDKGELEKVQLSNDTEGPKLVSSPNLEPWKEVFLADNKIPTSYVFSNREFTTTIGSDPEVFIVDENDQVIPAFEFLPKKPEKNVDGCAMQFYDGFQAEFTTSGGLHCIGYLTDGIRGGLSAVLHKARTKFPEAKLSARSVVNLPADAITKYDPQMFALGCAPSLNAYGEEPVHVDSPEMLPYRSSGWHMHFKPNWVTESGETSKRSLTAKSTMTRITDSIKTLDAILGTALVSFAQGYHDPRRRTLYGRAGEFRVGHTVEYRVPDVMLGAHPSTFNLFWDLGRTSWWLGMKGMSFLWDADEDEVREAINTSNVTLAQKILKRNEAVLKRMLTYSYFNLNQYVTPAFKAIFEGADAVLATPTDIEYNWRLTKDGGQWFNEGSRSHAQCPITWRQGADRINGKQKLS